MEMMKQWYYDLHQIPEVALKEDKTRAYIKQVLKNLQIPYTSLTGYDVLVYFDYHQKETIAFRSEMDGLEIEEKTGLIYSSIHPGFMHACGHDGHMAILLGLATYLKKVKECNYNVLLIFQMAEETIGGARMLCDAGIQVLYSINRIYALHNKPGLTSNTIYSKIGPFFSSSCEVDIIIKGKSSHVTSRDEGVDSLRAGVELYQLLLPIMKDESICFHMGSFNSGTIRNGVSDSTTLLGTLRGFDNSKILMVIEEIKEKIEVVKRLHGVEVITKFNHLYPVLDNSVNEIMFEPIESQFLCDDFSWYLQEIKGQYFLIGNQYQEPLHSSYYRFDEENLEAGLKFYLSILKIE